VSPVTFGALFELLCGRLRNVAAHGRAVDRSSGCHGPGVPAVGNGCVQSGRELGEAGGGAVPS
jgi:hypothetical protein